MATNVRVIRLSDFLRANAEGRVDLEAAKGLLRKVATAAASLQDYEVLIDIRDVVGRLTTDDVQELAESLVEFQSIEVSRLPARRARAQTSQGATRRSFNSCKPSSYASSGASAEYLGDDLIPGTAASTEVRSEPPPQAPRRQSVGQGRAVQTRGGRGPRPWRPEDNCPLSRVRRTSNHAHPQRGIDMEKTALDALLTRLVHDIAQFDGRDPSGLQVCSTDDGGIRVSSACASFVYQLEGWTHAFNQHLDAGFFGRQACIAPVESLPGRADREQSGDRSARR
jgi:hypothetical protein